MLSLPVPYCVIGRFLGYPVKVERNIVVVYDNVVLANKVKGYLVGSGDSGCKGLQCGSQTLGFKFKREQALGKLLTLHHRRLRLRRDGGGGEAGRQEAEGV